MLGNRSDYGGNRSLQYIQTKTRSPVFSSPTPLVGIYNIAPSQPQPCSGVTPSPSVPALPLLSAPPRCFLRTITTFTARRRFFPCFKLSTSPQPALCQFPLAIGAPLSTLWPVPSGHWDAFPPSYLSSCTCGSFFLHLKFSNTTQLPHSGTIPGKWDFL